MKKLLVLLVFGFALTLAACGDGEEIDTGVEYPVSYDYGTVVMATVDGDETSMTIEVDGYGDVPISVVAVVDADHSVVSLVVESHDETDGWGQDAIEDDEFIDSIIDGQDDLDSVDVYSGATVTSEALFDAVRTAQEHAQTLE